MATDIALLKAARWPVRLGLAAILPLGICIAGSDQASAPPTFSKDVAPILQQKCQDCHQPNSIAPMSLITYPEVRPWAKSIRQRVITR